MYHLRLQFRIARKVQRVNIVISTQQHVRSLLARHQHTGLSIFYILRQGFPIDIVHLRMVQELIEIHPLGSFDFPGTGCNFAFLTGGLVFNCAQRHHDIKVGTIEIEIMGMPHVHETFEASANASFFKYFPDDSIDEVFT